MSIARYQEQTRREFLSPAWIVCQLTMSNAMRLLYNVYISAENIFIYLIIIWWIPNREFWNTQLKITLMWKQTVPSSISWLLCFVSTVDPLYNVSVCSMWFVPLKGICCNKESAVLYRKMSKYVYVYLEHIDTPLAVVFIAKTSTVSSDESAHLCSLARACATRIQNINTCTVNTFLNVWRAWNDMWLLKLLFARPWICKVLNHELISNILALCLCSHIDECLQVCWHRDASTSFIVPVHFSLSRRMPLNYPKFLTTS